MNKRENINALKLPHTSRVNDKIIEYYTKFGKERDLEKFMRLYSSGSSQNSQNKSQFDSATAPSTINYSEDDYSDETQCQQYNTIQYKQSKSIKHQQKKKKLNKQNKSKNVMEIALPIAVAKSNRKPLKKSITQETTSESSEQLKTPKQTKFDSKATQTPESIAKSHKRLEWDSLGDVGYKKSMSASNISNLERRLLKEFFEDNDLPLPKHLTANSLNSNLKTFEEEVIGNTKFASKIMNTKHNTPPLASSTFVDTIEKSLIIADGKPKLISDKEVTTSLHRRIGEQHEKSPQTSIIMQPSVNSQEVQVDISTTKSSLIGSSMTQTSFEYFSSHSSQATTATTTNTTNSAAENFDFKVHRCENNSFVAGITEMLAHPKEIANKNKKDKADNNNHNNNGNEDDVITPQEKHQELHETIKSAFSKDNLFIISSQLDLGIKLLCSLINTNSLNQLQKNKLIRDIVNRICLNVENGEKFNIDQFPLSIQNNQLGNDSAVNSKAKNEKKTMKSVTGLRLEDLPKTTVNATKTSIPTKLKLKTKFQKIHSKNSRTIKSKNLVEEQMEIQPQINVLLTELPTTTKTDESNITTANTNSINTTSTSTSKELITQKNSYSQSAYDEQTINEWLNPMTQSEIEYEERKRGYIHTSSRAAVIDLNVNVNVEKKTQLIWLENEIKRLESLRHLLLNINECKNNKTNNKTTKTKVRKFSTNEIKELQNVQQYVQNDSSHYYTDDDDNNIYDTVCSLESAYAQNKGTEQLTQAIELIVEETTDNENRQKTGRKDDIYTTNTQQQAVNSKVSCVLQRSKINTPTDGVGVESVDSFVKQRTHDFKERYKNKKQLYYEAIIHKQQKQLKLLQRQLLEQQRKYQQQKQQQKQQQQRTISHNEHYSEPLAMQRDNRLVGEHYNKHKYKQHFVTKTAAAYKTYTTTTTTSLQTDSNTTPIPLPTSFNTKKNVSPLSPLYSSKTQVIYNVNNVNDNSIHDTNRNGTKEQFEQPPQCSTSSMFCLSSDVSIPMGSSSSSTVTTTHQYDDVAAGIVDSVGVQTGNSLLRTGAIFGKSFDQRISSKIIKQNFHIVYNEPKTKTACIQIKPKSIAYIIDFLKKPNNNTTTKDDNIKISELGKQPTIKDYLEKRNPRFCARSNERKIILIKLQTLRREREKRMRQIIENTSFNSLDKRLKRLPPPPAKQLRVFKTTEMKALTNKRCAYLPEILIKKHNERENRRRRSNRLIRDVFSRRLQQRVRKGQLTLNHSNTVI